MKVTVLCELRSSSVADTKVSAKPAASVIKVDT
jgi:hypothetical protein